MVRHRRRRSLDFYREEYDMGDFSKAKRVVDRFINEAEEFYSEEEERDEVTYSYRNVRNIASVIFSKVKKESLDMVDAQTLIPFMVFYVGHPEVLGRRANSLIGDKALSRGYKFNKDLDDGSLFEWIDANSITREYARLRARYLEQNEILDTNDLWKLSEAIYS